MLKYMMTFYRLLTSLARSFSNHTEAVFIVLNVLAAFAITYAGFQSGIHSGEASRGYALGTLRANNANTVYLDARLDTLTKEDKSISDITKREYQLKMSNAQKIIEKADNANYLSDQYAGSTVMFGVVTFLSTMMLSVGSRRKHWAHLLIALGALLLIGFSLFHLYTLFTIV